MTRAFGRRVVFGTYFMNQFKFLKYKGSPENFKAWGGGSTTAARAQISLAISYGAYVRF